MSEQVEKKHPQIVEIEWEEIQPVVGVRNKLLETERALATLLLDFEKKKSKLLSSISSLEESLQNIGFQLKVAKGLDESATYELKVPNDHGDKGYFIRKE